MANEITTYLKYANVQMAAEAIYPNSFTTGNIDSAILKLGNNRSSKFPDALAEQFVKDWEVVEHRSNTTTGFSGSLLRAKRSDATRGLAQGELVLSFRSTEFADDAARDNQATNTLEIKDKGWAFGQIADMEAWYASLKASYKIPAASGFTVTGYSLGGHLATAFNILRQQEANLGGPANPITATYTFNGAGVGRVTGRLGTLVSVMNEFKLRRASGNDDRFTISEVSDLYQTLKGSFREGAYTTAADAQNALDVINYRLRDIGAVEILANPVRALQKQYELGLLQEAMQRIYTIAVEAARAPALANDGGLQAGNVSANQIAALGLDYQLAVLSASNRTEPAAGLVGGATQAIIGRNTINPPIANFYDVYGSNFSIDNFSAVANSQLHYGKETPIFIEDQPLYRGTVLGDVGTESWKAGDVKLLVPNFSQNDFGDTHSLVLLVDSLAVQNTLAQLDPGASQDTLNTILRNSANTKGKRAAGQQGEADGKTLESLVNALGTYLGVDVASGWKKLEGNPDGGSWFELPDIGPYTGRISLHSDLALIAADPDYQDLVGKVKLHASTSDMADTAKQDFGALVALQMLSPFTLKAANADGEAKLGELWDSSWSDEYAAWQADKTARANESVATHFSDAWLADRADMLKWNNARNSSNTEDVRSPGVFQSVVYSDVESSTLFSVANTNANAQSLLQARRVIFGGDNADNISGGSKADRLYGGGGDDTLSGGNADKSNDYLEGGAGNDTYSFNGAFGSDTILDSDGQGAIQIDGATVTGGKQLSANVWQSDDKKLIFTQNSAGDLVIGQRTTEASSSVNSTITLKAWNSGQLGISLAGAAAPAPAPVAQSTFDLGSLDMQAQHIEEDHFNYAVATNPGQNYSVKNAAAANWVDAAAPEGVQRYYNAAVRRTGSGADLIEGGTAPAVSSILLASGAGADRVYAGTAQSLQDAIDDGENLSLPTADSSRYALDGGAGDDTLVGSSGRDALFGGAGDDILVGGRGGDVIIADGNAQSLFWQSDLSTRPLVTGQNDMSKGTVAQLNIYAAGATFGTPWVIASRSSPAAFAQMAVNPLAQVDFSGLAALQRVDIRGKGYSVGGVALTADQQYGEWTDGPTDLAPYTSNKESGDDTIYAGAGDDVVNAGAGNDIVFASTGNDAVAGYDGNDYIEGGDGDDLLYGDWVAEPAPATSAETHIDFYTADLVIKNTLNPALHGNDTMYGGIGNDVMIGGGGADDLWGGEGNDVIQGDGNGIRGAYAGDDYLDGEDGIDNLFGGAGKDQLEGGAGNDGMVGDWYEDDTKGGSDDYLNGDDGNDEMLGGAGADTMFGGAGNDYLSGDGTITEAMADAFIAGQYTLLQSRDPGADYLDGEAGNDTLLGGAGNDTLVGGTGSDILVGGAGDDVYVFSPGDGSDVIIDSQGKNTLRFTDSTFADATLAGVAGASADLGLMYSSTPGDQIVLTAGLASAGTMNISFADKTVAYADFVNVKLQTAVDVADSADGQQILGGTRADRVRVNHNGSTITTGGGNDAITIAGQNNTVMLRPGDGVDSIGSATNSASMGNALSFEYATSVADLAVGRATDGTLMLTDKAGTYGASIAGNAIDTVRIGTDGQSMSLRAVVQGLLDAQTSSGDDIVFGTQLDDTLRGGAGNDRLIGFEGNDTLIADGGVDELVGGAGDDTFVITAASAGVTISALEAGTFADPGHDTIVLAGSGAEADWRASSDGGDLILHFHAAADASETSVRLRDYWVDGSMGRAAWQAATVRFEQGDTISLAQLEASTWTGTDGSDTLRAPAPGTVLNGMAGNDILYGGAGVDYLFGGTGDDVLSGGGGNDYMDGGPGDDTYLFDTVTSHAGDAAIVSDAEGNNILRISGPANLSAVSAVANGADRMNVWWQGRVTHIDGGPAAWSHIKVEVAGQQMALQDLAALSSAQTHPQPYESGLVNDPQANAVFVASVREQARAGISQALASGALRSAQGAAVSAMWQTVQSDATNLDLTQPAYVSTQEPVYTAVSHGYVDAAGNAYATNIKTVFVPTSQLQNGADPRSAISADYTVLGVTPTMGDVQLVQTTQSIGPDGNLMISSEPYIATAPVGFAVEVRDNRLREVSTLEQSGVRTTTTAVNSSMAQDLKLGSGSNTATISAGIVSAGAGNDVIQVQPLRTLDAANARTPVSFLDGGDGNDELFGSSGADVLFGGTGSDVMDGGPGSDRYLVVTRDADPGDQAFSSVFITDRGTVPHGDSGSYIDYYGTGTGTGAGSQLDPNADVDTVQFGPGIRLGNIDLGVMAPRLFSIGANAYRYNNASTLLVGWQGRRLANIDMGTNGQQGSGIEWLEFFDGTRISLQDAVQRAYASNGAKPKEIAPIADSVVAAGDYVNVWALKDNFKDPMGFHLSYGASLDDGSALPEWLSTGFVNDSDGVRYFVWGKPPEDQLGTVLNLKINVTNELGMTVTDDVAVTLLAPNRAPVLTQPLADYTFSSGSPFSFSLPATTFVDPDPGDSVALSARSPWGMPDWLTFNPATGTFSGTAPWTDAGNFQIEIKATDTSGLSTSSTFNLSIEGAPSILGTSSSEVLNGTAGDDWIAGLAGDDTLNGGAGSDMLDGGAGADRMVGGLGDDTYVVDSASDVVVEKTSQGFDTVQSSVTYTLPVNVEVLFLTGTGNLDGNGNTLDNQLYGNEGDNKLFGNAGADYLVGGAGDDWLRGGVGDDYMEGGTGDDLYEVDSSGDVVAELANEGDDTVEASINYTLSDYVENLILTGTADLNGTGNALDNALQGNDGANTLTGGDGNDVLNGKKGADVLIGGMGNDTYLFEDDLDLVVEQPGEGRDTIISQLSFTLAANVEDGVLLGSASGITGNALSNVLTGNAAANVLDGGAGADVLMGGKGNDTYVVDRQADTVVENAGEGTDEVQASVNYALADNVENLTLTGTAEAGMGNDLANRIVGNALSNKLWGGAGNDTIDGAGGADLMVGGLGNDTYYVDSADDLVFENAAEGTDKVFASVSYALSDNVENLTLTGTANINAVGNAGNNVLEGNAGNNVLFGGLGNDTYNFGRGSGQDIIVNFDAGKPSSDKVQLGAGIATADVALARRGTDLVLRINGTQDQLTVLKYFENAGKGSNALEKVRFADGTSWSYATVNSLAVAESGASPADGLGASVKAGDPTSLTAQVNPAATKPLDLPGQTTADPQTVQESIAANRARFEQGLQNLRIYVDTQATLTRSEFVQRRSLALLWNVQDALLDTQLAKNADGRFTADVSLDSRTSRDLGTTVNFLSAVKGVSGRLDQVARVENIQQFDLAQL